MASLVLTVASEKKKETKRERPRKGKQGREGRGREGGGGRGKTGRQSDRQTNREKGLFVCLLVAYRPSNMRVYLRDGSAQTILRAATLR